tara:strand:+ start:217 stop:567 length:351 start_codon:yes stop_codon:yes gene_type:complete
MVRVNPAMLDAFNRLRGTVPALIARQVITPQKKGKHRVFHVFQEIIKTKLVKHPVKHVQPIGKVKIHLQLCVHFVVLVPRLIQVPHGVCRAIRVRQAQESMVLVNCANWGNTAIHQ